MALVSFCRVLIPFRRLPTTIQCIISILRILSLYLRSPTCYLLPKMILSFSRVLRLPITFLPTPPMRHNFLRLSMYLHFLIIHSSHVPYLHLTSKHPRFLTVTPPPPMHFQGFPHWTDMVSNAAGLQRLRRNILCRQAACRKVRCHLATCRKVLRHLAACLLAVPLPRPH